jgi:hypothetical protein
MGEEDYVCAVCDNNTTNQCGDGYTCVAPICYPDCEALKCDERWWTTCNDSGIPECIDKSCDDCDGICL